MTRHPVAPPTPAASSRPTPRHLVRAVAAHQPGWLAAIGAANLVLTMVLLPAGVMLVLDPTNFGGPWAAVLVSLAVATLLAFRRAPATAALAAAVLTLATQLLTGPLVTCGVMVPVMCAMTPQVTSGPVSSWVARVRTAAASAAAAGARRKASRVATASDTRTAAQ